MNSLVDLALRNRPLVLALTLFLVLAGAHQAYNLPIDAVPDVTPNQVMVMTRSPGLGPIEVERLLTLPLEANLGGLPGLNRIRSVSKYGLSILYLQFDDGRDIYFTRNLVANRLQSIERQLGVNASPEMGPISSGVGEIYQFELRAPGVSLMDRRTILDWDVIPKLKLVPGVIEINVNGGEMKTFEVQIDAERLVRYGVSTAQVIEALERNNGARGGAALLRNREQQIIRGEGLIERLSDIEDIVVAVGEGGTPIFIRTIAAVAEAARVRLGAVTRDGRGEVVIGTVMMLIGETPGRVTDRVKQALVDIGQILPPGVSIDMIYDRSVLIHRTISTVALNLAEGAALVVMVLLLMLGSVRAGLIVALAIPLSLLAALIGMDLAGISGNLMSLGAIDFGLIVDGAVVIVENIVRRQANRPPGQPVQVAISEAVHEVARPVMFAVITIIIVYLPVLTLQGVEGKMFKPMALTVMFALGASLVIALALMPVLAVLLYRVGVNHHAEPVTVRLLRRAYEPMLRAAQRGPVWIVAGALLVFVGGIGVAHNMGAEFMPRLDEGSITVTSLRLPGVALATSTANTTLIEKVLRTFPEVVTAVSVTGSAEIPIDPMGLEETDTLVMLKPRSEWTSGETKTELIEKIDAALQKNVAGTVFSYLQPIEMRLQDLVVGVRSDVAISIYGEDPQVLKRKADEIVNAIDGIDGARDVKAEQVAGLPYLRVRIDRAALARFGINASQVLDVVEAMGGRTVGQVMSGTRRFPLQVRFSAADRADIDRIKAIRIADQRGRFIPLGDLAEVFVEDGASQITHERLQRRITVEANIRGRDLSGFVAEAQRTVAAKVGIPPGYVLRWGGQFENLKDASQRLAIVVPVALCLIFLLLYTMFRSARLATLIFINVPIAATGGIFALALRDLPFSISAAIGFIALFGVAVLNGVVLVSYIDQLSREGRDAVTAAGEAAMIRMRPVLMTALVASLGFLPMALSQGAGAEVQRPLATVVIGGLISSTLLTLLVLPAIYPWFAGRRRIEAPAAAPAPAE